MRMIRYAGFAIYLAATLALAAGTGFTCYNAGWQDCWESRHWTPEYRERELAKHRRLMEQPSFIDQLVLDAGRPY